MFFWQQKWYDCKLIFPFPVKVIIWPGSEIAVESGKKSRKKESWDLLESAQSFPDHLWFSLPIRGPSRVLLASVAQLKSLPFHCNGFHPRFSPSKLRWSHWVSIEPDHESNCCRTLNATMPTILSTVSSSSAQNRSSISRNQLCWDSSFNLPALLFREKSRFRAA